MNPGAARRARRAVALAVAALMAGAWWLLRGEEPATIAAPDAAAAVAATGAADHGEPTERTTPAPEPTLATVLPDWAAQPFGFEVELRSLAKQGCWSGILIGVDGASLSRAEFGWDGDGRAQLAFAARQKHLVLLADTGHLRRIPAVAGAAARITFDAWLSALREQTADPPPPPDSASPFAAASFRAGHELAAFGHGAEGEHAIEEGWDSACEAGGPVRRIVRGSVEGLVVDANGAPLASVPVTLVGVPFHSTTTSGGGRFTFADLKAGTYSVRAGNTALGAAGAPVTITGGPTTVRLQLDRGAFVAGRVTGPDGRPLRDRRILWCTADGDWRNSVTSGADGTFVLANLPGPGALWACDGRDGVRLPAAGLPRVVPDGNEVSLTIDPAACRGTLRIAPLLPADLPADLVAVRAWQAESGIGAHLSLLADGRTFELLAVPAGFYSLEAVGPGLPVVPLGRHWVDGRSVCDLGSVALPAPGRVRFDLPPDDAPAGLATGEQALFEIYWLRADVDLHVQLLQPPPGEHALPAGDFAVVWRDATQRLRSERFTVRSGETAVVRLPR